MAQARRIVQFLASAALGGVCTLGPALTFAVGVGAATPAASAKTGEQDTLILRSGKIIEGRIIEEKADEVIFEVNVAGIKAKTSYKRSDILSMTKGEGGGEGEAGAPAADPGVKMDTAKPAEVNDAAPKVYVMELEGWFGEDISQTPIKQAAMDAKRHGVDYIVVVLNNDWSMERFGQLGEIKDDVGQFDQLFRVEDMDPVFTEEIPSWDKVPKVIFWVKKAMGGAAFLPLNCDTIYFSSDAKMGGIGHLNRIFGQTGDEVVRQKQFSLRIGHAEGMAITGGYDPKLIRAMAVDEYELSVAYEGGKPVFYERTPERGGETLLTDDGKEGNVDTIQELARGEGNDCLTLNAELAYKLGVSKGTVDSLEDLLFHLGIARNHQIVKGQSENIMKGWRDGVESAKRRLTNLWEDFGEVEVAAPGEYQQRTQARGRRKSIINEMQALIRRYEEAFNPNQIGVPDYNQLEEQKRLIELQQLQDSDRR